MLKQNSKGLVPPTQSVTASKKEYQGLWKIFFLFTLIAFVFLMQKVYQFQTFSLQKGVRLGNLTELLFFGTIFALIFALIDFGVHKILDGVCDKYFINHTKYPIKQSRQKRCFTLVKFAYSITYYLISSTSAIIILKETHIWPSFLGGNGECSRMFQGFPDAVQTSKYMKIFYICQFGKHLARAFLHLFIRSQGNYYQYALHHGLSTFLIVFSYLMNYWYVGVMILFVHDASDIFLGLSRAYRDYKNRSGLLNSILDIFTFVSWFGLRLLLFPICTILPSINSLINYFPAIKPEQMSNQKFSLIGIMYYPSVFLIFMLIMLQILQLFWTYYIFRSIVAISVAPKLTTHNYD